MPRKKASPSHQAAAHGHPQMWGSLPPSAEPMGLRLGLNRAVQCDGVGVNSALQCGGVGVNSALQCGGVGVTVPLQCDGVGVNSARSTLEVSKEPLKHAK